MNTKKRKRAVQGERVLDAILKKARVPSKLAGNPEEFAKRVLRRLRLDKRHARVRRSNIR